MKIVRSLNLLGGKMLLPLRRFYNDDKNVCINNKEYCNSF